jgi:hypothetical protein
MANENCEKYKELFAAGLDHELNKEDKTALEKHMESCPACHEEFIAMQLLWDEMLVLEAPEPSAHMRDDFHAMLGDYKQQVNNINAGSSFWSRLWQSQPRWPLAYTFAVMLLCVGLCYTIFKPSKQEAELNELTSQVHELKQTMMLTMLQNPSASERIKAVSYTSELNHADKQVIDALLATLNNDPNVNVRLSTLDALTQLAGYPEVREGLVKSISQQDSPIMQSAIADVMLKLQEKQSVKPLKQLLKQKGLDNGVRDKIKETINNLI